MNSSRLQMGMCKGGQVLRQLDDFEGKRGASADAETTAPGCPSALRSKLSVGVLHHVMVRGIEGRPLALCLNHGPSGLRRPAGAAGGRGVAGPQIPRHGSGKRPHMVNFKATAPSKCLEVCPVEMVCSRHRGEPFWFGSS